jgi:hypothetical protein
MVRRKVWILYHVHEWDDGHEDIKLIGVFESREDAQRAQTLVADQPGFRDLPEGFEINEHALGDVSWLEGYITVEPGDP